MNQPDSTKPKRPRGRPLGPSKPDAEKLTIRLDVPLSEALHEMLIELAGPRKGPEWVRGQIEKAYMEKARS